MLIYRGYYFVKHKGHWYIMTPDLGVSFGQSPEEVMKEVDRILERIKERYEE